MIASNKYWQIDPASLNEVRKLKSFVDFIAGLHVYSINRQESPEEYLAKAERVKFLIDNLDKPETFPTEWMVCLDISDDSFESKPYRKKWWLTFFEGLLEVTAESYRIDEEGFGDEESSFYAFVNFKQEVKWKRMDLETDLNEFMRDAANFRSYLSEQLNFIETEIGIW